MAITFTVAYRGKPVLHGNYDTPGSAMPRGIGVVQSSDTIAKAAVGSTPTGFLNTEVTDDGPSYEERLHIPIDSTILNEQKISVGKVQVIGYDPGVFYITKGNVGGSTVFAKDEQVLMAANGEFNDLNEASVGDVILGVVEKIDVHFMGEDNCIVWQAIANLGVKV